ncbi:hypothetical protein KIW84_046208, partial [Lathyrus oleraceus]
RYRNSDKKKDLGTSRDTRLSILRLKTLQSLGIDLCPPMSRGCNHLIKDISISCLQLNHMKQFLSRSLAQRLTSPRQSFSRIGTQIPRCLRSLQLYFKIKPPEVTKPQPPASTPNGTTSPGVPPRPMPPASQAPLPPPPPPQGLPPGAPLGNPPRAPPPPMSGSMPPPPPMSANGPRPVPGAMP